jgi:hypothetical protein
MKPPSFRVKGRERMTRRLCLTLALLALTLSANAATLYDAGGFEGYTLGDVTGQNGWLLDTASTTQYTVSSLLPATGTKALRADGGATNWAFPDLSYTPTSAEVVRIQADIARNLGTTSSFGYSIDVYNAAVARTFRFGLVNNAGVIQPFVTSRFNTTTSLFDETAAVTNVLVGGAVPADTFVSFDAFFDYNTKRVNLLVNGTSVTGGFDIPFVTLAATDMADADFQVSSVAGADDRGFLDNYLVTTVAIPEPSGVALLGLGGLGALGVLRRRR